MKAKAYTIIFIKLIFLNWPVRNNELQVNCEQNNILVPQIITVNV